MTPSEKQEAFVIRFANCREDLRRYIFSLTGNLQDSDDILQETSLALWRKYDSYDPEKPFLNWAFRFAYFEVMKFRERQTMRQTFCQETLKLLAEEHAEEETLMQKQQQLLERCIHRLEAEERELIELRYEQGKSVKEMNRILGESGKRLYRSLERIRHKLTSCVNLALAQEEL